MSKKNRVEEMIYREKKGEFVGDMQVKFPFGNK